MSQRKYKKLYDAQADGHRRRWLQQRGRGETVRLTSRQSAELKRWFEFWDRDASGGVNPRDIANALYSLNVLSCEQKEELDALIDAATDGEDATFGFSEFRTLMTYPKCGIAKTLLGVLEHDIFGEEATMPFHLRVQAHNREKLMAGLMSKNSSLRKESERQLGQVEAQIFRRQKLAEKAERERQEQERAASVAAASPAPSSDSVAPSSHAPASTADEKGWSKVRARLTPSRGKQQPVSKMVGAVKEAIRQRADGSNAGIPLHSKILFPRPMPVESKIMKFRPSDFFSPDVGDLGDAELEAPMRSRSMLSSSLGSAVGASAHMGEWRGT